MLLLLLLQSPPATFITAAHPSMPCAGEFMWMADAGGGTAAERHYAQRYRQLRAQLDRSIEERAILATEVIRTFNWLEEREEAIEARMVELQGSMGGGGGAQPQAVAGICRGTSCRPRARYRCSGCS